MLSIDIVSSPNVHSLNEEVFYSVDIFLYCSFYYVPYKF